MKRNLIKLLFKTYILTVIVYIIYGLIIIYILDLFKIKFNITIYTLIAVFDFLFSTYSVEKDLDVLQNLKKYFRKPKK